MLQLGERGVLDMGKIVKNMVKQLINKIFSILVASSRSKALIINVLYDHPQVCIEAFGKRTNLSQRFENVSALPAQVDNFEDLCFLFSCTQLNMGIANLALDEAAYLYKIIRKLNSANLVEIGRFKGGGTFLMAAAMDAGAHLCSYDIHIKMKDCFDGEAMDKILCQVLEKYGLSDSVDIIVGNSNQVDVGTEPVDLIFIDGDHSYEGVKRDFLHWYKSISSGGHLLFHDAARARAFSSYHREVAKFVQEVERDFGEYFHKKKEVGALVHFIRTEESFEEK